MTDADRPVALAGLMGGRLTARSTPGEGASFTLAVLFGTSEAVVPAPVLDRESRDVTARALAPMERLLGYAQPYLQRGAQGLFLKGEKAEVEVAEARKVWQFKSDLSVSRSDPRGRIVSVRSLRRVQSR